MKQSYHSNATTNVRLRSEINKSEASICALSIKYGVSAPTIYKWKNRSEFEDKSSRPNSIHYALSELEMIIATKLRSLTWWSLDEITEVVSPLDPVKIRSAVYRTFAGKGINTAPKKKKQKSLKNTTLVLYM